MILLVFFLVLPKMGQVGEAEDELATAQAAAGNPRVAARRARAGGAAAPEARATIQDVERRIPPTADEPGLLLLREERGRSLGGDAVEPHPGDARARPDFGALDDPARRDGLRELLPAHGVPLQHRDAAAAAKVVNVTLAPGAGEGDDDDHHDDRANLLQLQASVMLYTSDQSAGPGSEPGSDRRRRRGVRDDAADASRPADPDDRRRRARRAARRLLR